MTRWVAAVFAVLVAATFAAFFVAQRLKNTPSIVQQLEHAGVFSPNRDGRKDRLRITFKLKQADDVTVQMLDADGDPVRTVLDDAHVGRYAPIKPALAWDGRDDDGRMVPDGRYRIRITLRGQGRSVISQRSVLKDTKPPQPRVTSIGPQDVKGPELLPGADGGPARIHFGPALAKARLLIFKTGPGTPRLVHEEPLTPGATSATWNGTDAAGRPVSPGTYLVVPEWRDRAENVGTAVPLDRRGLPILRRSPLPGRGGITVRYLAARPPVTAGKARDRMTIEVDARRQRYTWSLRRLGGPVRKRSTRPKMKTTVVFSAPGGKSGVYVFDARTATRRTQVVVPVQARNPVAGTAAAPKGVLVVLPVITWQGRNDIDDDGDGAPNTLDLGGPARPFRLMAGDGLPEGFVDREAPLLQWLDRTGRRYDVTTDLALLAGRGPRLTGHHGVLIPGDARWLPARLRTNLRTFVRGGGTVVSTGTDSLRRTVALDAEGRLAHPSAERAIDLFGARLRPLVTKTTNVEIFADDPAVSLFQGSEGLFADVPAWEETAGGGPDAEIVSRAVTVDPPAKNVVVAARYGRGLVIRPGFPDFARRLSTNDPAVTALTARMWTLLSR